MRIMTSTSSDRPWSVSPNRAESFKFPDFEESLASGDTVLPQKGESLSKNVSSARTPSPNVPKANGILQSSRWQHRRGSHLAWENTHSHVLQHSPRHDRQKSLSDAIRTIRTRKGSVSANAQEIAEALKAPVSIKLVVRIHFCMSTLLDALMAEIGPVYHMVHELCSH